MTQRGLCTSGPANEGTSKQFHHSVELGKRRKEEPRGVEDEVLLSPWNGSKDKRKGSWQTCHGLK